MDVAALRAAHQLGGRRVDLVDDLDRRARTGRRVPPASTPRRAWTFLASRKSGASAAGSPRPLIRSSASPAASASFRTCETRARVSPTLAARSSPEWNWPSASWRSNENPRGVSTYELNRPDSSNVTRPRGRAGDWNASRGNSRSVRATFTRRCPRAAPTRSGAVSDRRTRRPPRLRRSALRSRW